MPTIRSPGFWALAALLALAACGDGTTSSAPAAALLRTDSTAITLTQSTPLPHVIQVFVKNTGAAGLHVRMCNNGGFPGADLRLQELQAEVWTAVLWPTCDDPTDGYDLAVAPGTEAQLGRVIPAPHGGVFRFGLVVGSQDGDTFAISSNSFDVHVVP